MSLLLKDFEKWNQVLGPLSYMYVRLIIPGARENKISKYELYFYFILLFIWFSWIVYSTKVFSLHNNRSKWNSIYISVVYLNLTDHLFTSETYDQGNNHYLIDLGKRWLNWNIVNAFTNCGPLFGRVCMFISYRMIIRSGF